LVDGLEQVLGNPSIRTIWGENAEDGRDSSQQSDNEYAQHRVAQPMDSFGKAIFVLLATQTGDDILKDTHWANDAAIHPSEHQGQDQEKGYHQEIDGEQAGTNCNLAIHAT
jgi:hypothetical protein